MTLLLTVSCDGHRHGQRCRGAYSHPADYNGAGLLDAYRAAVRRGWRGQQGVGHVCPSRGHDEDPTP